MATDPFVTGPPRRWIFFTWLGVFYAAWATLVLAGDLVVTVRDHWPIALSMAAGSYFAGSTPMGGGAVGFPVLVLLFDEPASLGRNFGFAVQSIGMTSASIYILSSRQRVDWTVLKVALPVALLVVPLSAAFVAPAVPSRGATLLFAVVVAAFGLIHLLRLRDVLGCTGLGASAREGAAIGLTIGVVGGVVASMTGVGIDMLVYMAMLAVARVDLRVAIPTSVILMAFSSIVGIASNAALGTVDPEVFGHWLAAAPVVALGAPFGAIAVTYLSRTKTLVVTSVLCVGQLVWTVVSQRVGGATLVATVAGLAVLLVAFFALFALGARRQATRAVPVRAAGH